MTMRTETALSPTNPRPECGAEAPTFLSAVYKRGTQAKKRQAYAPQYGRLLSLCAGDAPQVSNDVYNQRYTSEKLASRYKQSGRSMIEMLGVLAIIGVLTVGSIAGYNKAMEYHLFNIQREQLHTLFSAAFRHMDQLRLIDDNKYPGGSYPLVYALDALGEIPQNMLRGEPNERTTLVYDVFGTQIGIYYHSTHYLGFTFGIGNTEHSFHICKNIINVAKMYEFEISYIFSRNDFPTGRVWNYSEAISRNDLKDITISEINQKCRVCVTNSCVMYVIHRG